MSHGACAAGPSSLFEELRVRKPVHLEIDPDRIQVRAQGPGVSDAAREVAGVEDGVVALVAREPSRGGEIRSVQRVDLGVVEPREIGGDELVGRSARLPNPAVLRQLGAVDRVVHRPAQPRVGKRAAVGVEDVGVDCGSGLGEELLPAGLAPPRCPGRNAPRARARPLGARALTNRAGGSRSRRVRPRPPRPRAVPRP